MSLESTHLKYIFNDWEGLFTQFIFIKLYACKPKNIFHKLFLDLPMIKYKEFWTNQALYSFIRSTKHYILLNWIWQKHQSDLFSKNNQLFHSLHGNIISPILTRHHGIHITKINSVKLYGHVNNSQVQTTLMTLGFHSFTFTIVKQTRLKELPNHNFFSKRCNMSMTWILYIQTFPRWTWRAQLLQKYSNSCQ